MSQPEYLPAHFDRQSDHTLAQWSLNLDSPTPEVWAALIRSDHLAQWLAPGSIDPRMDGVARLDFVDSGGVIDSKVTAFEAQHLREYSSSSPGQPARPLRWTLNASGAGTALALSLGVPNIEDVALAAAG